MNLIRQSIPDVFLIEPRVFDDERGFFFETISISKLNQMGIDFEVVQENCAYSKRRGTIRGLHFQNYPVAQAKIVRCTLGSVVDYAIDLRKNSPTYLKHVAVELTSGNKRQLYIPRGFAHGVISTADNTMIEYYADNPYSPENDRSIRYNDPQINIQWGYPDCDLILSEKDKKAPLLKNIDCNF